MQREEIKSKIKKNYKTLKHLFSIYRKPNKEMREIQHETWSLKKELNVLNEISNR